jgi:solute carrier family 50 protein (sugar transporter)
VVSDTSFLARSDNRGLAAARHRTIYGFLTRTLTIVSVNAYGTVASAYFIAVFFSYSSAEQQQSESRQIAIVLATGLACLLFGLYDHVTATPVIGLLASALSIAFFASPLAQMSQVIRTKSVESMSFGYECVCDSLRVELIST